MFKVNNKDTKTAPSSVFIVNFEHVITGWECFKNRLLRGINIFLSHRRNLIEAHLRHYQTTMVESLSVLHQFCNMLHHRCLKGLQPGIAYLYPRKTLENLQVLRYFQVVQINNTWLLWVKWKLTHFLAQCHPHFSVRYGHFQGIQKWNSCLKWVNNLRRAFLSTFPLYPYSMQFSLPSPSFLMSPRLKYPLQTLNVTKIIKKR